MVSVSKSAWGSFGFRAERAGTTTTRFDGAHYPTSGTLRILIWHGRPRDKNVWAFSRISLIYRPHDPEFPVLRKLFAVGLFGQASRELLELVVMIHAKSTLTVLKRNVQRVGIAPACYAPEWLGWRTQSDWNPRAERSRVLICI